eukprot:TRINITY_DN8740_c0_g1_i2.p1 TRINITY_DN8740_c0_g1~~TRINITY_DN8740_c0_g1_i2.p1  ORF type:complete len:254 (+),score=66.51 TRINITY_DN8740_c0_g1_i2:59-763(+)
MSSEKLVVAYWHIRGLGAPLRMMCEYAGVDYEPVTYEAQGSPGSWDLSAWFSVKPGLVEKNPLMNLPYVIDGDVVVTQSNACLLYLGRKFGLNGKTDAEVIKNDQCLCQVMDLRNDLVGLVYSGKANYDAKIDNYLSKTAMNHLTKMENWLAKEGTTYCCSNEPTTSDFHLWEMLDQHEKLAAATGKPSFLEQLPNLQKLYKAFAELPAIKKYVEGPLHKLPLNNKMAAFGGSV